MIKFLLFVFLLVLAYAFGRGVARRENPRPGPTRRRASRAEAETVKACAHCGVLAPPSEGVETQGFFYCSAEHARLGPKVRR